MKDEKHHMSSRLHTNQMKNHTVDTSSKILGKLDCINRGQFDTRYIHTGLHNGSHSWLGTASSITKNSGVLLFCFVLLFCPLLVSCVAIVASVSRLPIPYPTDPLVFTTVH